MLFTWSTKNLCIIFPQWRVAGPFSLFVSLVVIVLLTAGYEGVRKATKRYEAGYKQRLGAFGATSITGKSSVLVLLLHFSAFALIVGFGK